MKKEGLYTLLGTLSSAIHVAIFLVDCKGKKFAYISAYMRRVKSTKTARNKKSTYNRKCFKMRAENGTQTRDPQLGRLVLYRLSYFRSMWGEQDSNLRRRCQLSYSQPQLATLVSPLCSKNNYFGCKYTAFWFWRNSFW